MKMKIQKPYGANMVQSYQKQQAAKPTTNKASAQRDQLSISEEAKVLLDKKATSSLQRQEKVNELKQQIENGTYKVDKHKVAEKVYQFWFQK